MPGAILHGMSTGFPTVLHMTYYELFDRQALELLPLSRRDHECKAASCLPLLASNPLFLHSHLPGLADMIWIARGTNRPMPLLLGAHPIKLGLSRYLIDLVDRGFITHLATNGAGVIHDFELALVGGTSEDVP